MNAWFFFGKKCVLHLARMFNVQEILVLEKTMLQKLINFLEKFFGVNIKKDRQKEDSSDDIYPMW